MNCWKLLVFLIFLSLAHYLLAREFEMDDSYSSVTNVKVDGNSSETENYDNGELFRNLTEQFPCVVTTTGGLFVSCIGVDFLAVAEYIPAETKSLEITDSYFPMFYKPLFAHLHCLESLTLSNNSHRFMTSKAFVGLNNLKKLNLSDNDIVVISKLFTYTPNLESVDLSSNKIINIKTITLALTDVHSLKNLSFSYNVGIKKILSEDFSPVQNSNLEKIELINTTIKLVEKGVFLPLFHLKQLDLSINYIGEAALQNITGSLLNTSITNLILRQLTLLDVFPYNALTLLQNTSIFHLNLGYNFFQKLPKFPYIPTLYSLNLSFCSIREIFINAFENLPNLGTLMLLSNKIFSMDGTITALTSLRHLSISTQHLPNLNNGIFKIKDFGFRNMTNLEFLYLSYVQISGWIHRYHFYGLNSTVDLFLLRMQITGIDDYSFETLTSLKILNLETNSVAHLTNFTFYGLKRLEILKLSQNNIFFAENSYPFQYNPLLQILYLHRNEIVKIPQGVFSALHELRILILFQNNIIPWNQTILSPKANLTIWHLSSNQITHFTLPMLSELSRVTQTLDLTSNPFNCSSCSMDNFQNFMNQSNISFFYPTSDTYTNIYSCLEPKELQGKAFQEVELQLDHCHPNIILVSHLSIGVLLTSVLTFAIALLWLCYVFRWYLRYWLFHFRAAIKERRASKDENFQYIYDAFVSYNSTDTNWIITHLIPELEHHEPRLRLCIHERDFEVGRLITENILDSIEVSRKVILVLTEDFIKSEWCMFELHMAQHKLFDDTRDALVLVKLKTIDRKLYTKDLLYLEKTRTCIMWTENPVGQKLFWDKMRKALGMPRTAIHPFNHQTRI